MNTGVTDAFIVNALAVIAWLAWAQLTLALLIEAIAAVRGHQPRDLPLAPGLQAAAARLVAGIVMLVAPLQPARAVAAPAHPVAVAAPTEVAEPVIDLRAAASTVNPTSPQPTIATASSPSVPGTASRTVTVERHDSYWAIAERELGDGLRWREVQALNGISPRRSTKTLPTPSRATDPRSSSWPADPPATATRGGRLTAGSTSSTPPPPGRCASPRRQGFH